MILEAEYYRPPDEEDMSHYFRIDNRGRGEKEPKSENNSGMHFGSK